jgi:hypothetical protein
MGHDEHFLERLDRVTYDQTELALALYRDHLAVRHLLDREAIPAEAPRVAISLADADRGPFVIVARDGHFVTCLGEGMSPGPWPILPKAALEGSLEFAATARYRTQVAREIARPDERDGGLVNRIFKRKNLLSREEISGIAAFAPLFVEELLDRAVRFTDAIVVHARCGRRETVRDRSGTIRNATDLHARSVWATAYAMELAGTVEPRTILRRATRNPELALSAATTFLIDAPFVHRGIWTAGMIGTGLVDFHARTLAERTDVLSRLDAALGLAAIGLRHPEALPEVSKILRRIVATADGSLASDFGTKLSEVTQQVLRSPVEFRSWALAVGRRSYLTAIAGKLLPGDVGYAERIEDVPQDLAITAFLNTSGGYLQSDGYLLLLGGAAVVAKCDVEHFHYPEAIVRKVFAPWGAPEVSQHLALVRETIVHTATRRNDAKVSRNDPCHCGSGKKAKRCCA